MFRQLNILICFVITSFNHIGFIKYSNATIFQEFCEQNILI